ncbi:predicted protein [Streptomyces viridosporus ATCC 14672]|uniref:Predicted protein n=1 Tax=Streptomyces viridosporus (strain ATCC 14672 / DSM 40746 / JCM 4963 / KCTC 9882 / NRRL B-12104 / FH 1290) TaxID=566461 RepID=D6A8K0_STRV1|nr:predicted protein [Streptomyces viridosporus ATCC 14672]
MDRCGRFRAVPSARLSGYRPRELPAGLRTQLRQGILRLFGPSGLGRAYPPLEAPALFAHTPAALQFVDL